MQDLNDFLLIFALYVFAIVLILLLSKAFHVFKIGIWRRRAFLGLTLFIVISGMYLLRSFWIDWISHSQRAERYALYGLGTLWWFSMAYMCSNMLHFTLWQGWMRKDGESTAPRLLRDFMDAVMYTLAFILTVHYVFGQPVNGLLATSGVFAFIVGFAAQNTLGGVISGLSLNMSRSFEKGDRIRFRDYYGEIVDVNWRSVTLRSRENNYLIIPNSVMTNEVIINLSRPDTVRLVETSILLPYDLSPMEARELLLQSIQSSPLVEEAPIPEVWLRKYDEGGIRYALRFYTKVIDPGQVESEVLSTLWYRFHRMELSLRPVTVQEEIVREYTPWRPYENVDFNNQKINLISQIPIFKLLQEGELLDLSSRAHRKLFGHPEQIVREGERGDSLFIVESGSLQVFTRQEDGRNLQVAVLSSGAIFGEMALLTGEPRKATVVAMTDAIVYEISKRDFAPILRSRKSLEDELIKMLAIRQVEVEMKSADYKERLLKSGTELEQIENRLRILMRNFFQDTTPL